MLQSLFLDTRDIYSIIKKESICEILKEMLPGMRDSGRLCIRRMYTSPAIRDWATSFKSTSSLPVDSSKSG